MFDPILVEDTLSRVYLLSFENISNLIPADAKPYIVPGVSTIMAIKQKQDANLCASDGLIFPKGERWTCDNCNEVLIHVKIEFEDKDLRDKNLIHNDWIKDMNDEDRMQSMLGHIYEHQFKFNPEIKKFIDTKLFLLSKNELDDPMADLDGIMVGMDFSENGSGDPQDFIDYYSK